MLRILRFLKAKEWWRIGAGVLFIVVQVWLDLKLPAYMQEITALVLRGDGVTQDIWIAGGNMLLCALGSLSASVLTGLFAAQVSSSFARTLRSAFYHKVDSFSMAEINRFSTASLITRSTNDITQVRMMIAFGLQLIVKAPITAVWAISMIAGKGFAWTLATGIAVLVIIAMLSLIVIFVVPKFKKMQTLTDDLTRVSRENLTGLRVVRAYNAENYQSEKFEGANDALTSTQLFTERAMAIAMPVMTLLLSGLGLATYWIGAYLLNDAAGVATKVSTFSNMLVFSQYAVQVVMSFMMLGMLFVLFPRASVSAKRIDEVLQTEPSIKDGQETKGEPGLLGHIVFDHVSFKYPDAEDYVLRDISFTANRGDVVALIGSTGSGKSSVVNLIPRFYDASEGTIRIDGVDVREYTLDALHNKIGYVPQQAVLLMGTVASNVALGENGQGAYAEDAVRRAVAIAQAEDFVEGMEGQYEADIAQSGTNISGGQKQRLAIARAVCRNPEFYIFDDSFSALDFATDRTLREALRRETGGVTNLLVAQRVGTILDADLIVVLEEGRIVGKGKHEELLRSCEVYREIAQSQLSKEELGL